jgi:anti-sigma regulatory factor (Ser/Thr protein kinase)
MQDPGFLAMAGASRRRVLGFVRDRTEAFRVPGRTARFELPGGENAPRTARRAVESLDGLIAPALQDDVRLLVSELVANSVRHAGVGPGDSLTLVLSVSDERLRVEVREPDHGFQPSFPTPPESSGSGSGLFIVERLADRWGITREAGTCVWFEIDGPGGSARGGGARRG